MATISFDHWQQFPAEQWRWPSFSPEELRNRDDDDPKLIVDFEALDKLQALRDLLGHPIIINSAGRTTKWNRHVGGEPDSYHLRGRAFDVLMANQDPAAFEAAARAVGFTGFGYYAKHKNPFMHIDTGPARWWGHRFPQRKSAPVPLPRPAEEPETEVNTVEASEADRFPPEQKKPGWLESIAKPEVLLPTGGAGFGLPAALEWIGETLRGSVPLQIAAAVLLVAAVIGVGAWLVLRQRNVRAGD